MLKTFWSIFSEHSVKLFSLDVTAEAIGANIDWNLALFEGGGSVWPKIPGKRGRFPPTILRVGKLR